jgi:hypothetical protein
LSLAYPQELDPDIKVCVTLGVMVNPELKKRVKFLDDPQIPHRQVADTCEQCGVENCESRVAPPTLLEQRQVDEQTQEFIERYPLT